MIHYKKDMRKFSEANPAGGSGMMNAISLFSSEDLDGKTGMFATVALEPHSVVGEHLHTNESEVYYILSGEGVLIEDGVRYPISTGDAELCLKGHSHGLENPTDEPVVFLALELRY